MDTFLAILAVICALIGIAGSILPVLPGPPVAYLGLLLAMWSRHADFSTEFLVIWGIVTAAVTLMDYYLPIYFTRRFGGSKKATWGATIGLVVGLFLGPVGIILGPFAGAYIGESINDRSDNKKVWKVAFGSFAAFVFGTGLKMTCSIFMAWYIVRAIFF